MSVLVINRGDTSVNQLNQDLNACGYDSIDYCIKALNNQCDSMASILGVYNIMLYNEGQRIDTALLDNVYSFLYNGAFLPYDQIIGEINNCNPNNTAILTQITYSAANFAYSSDSFGHTFIDFDLLATDTPQNLLFAQGYIYLVLDSNTFGTYLVTNGKITATKGTIDSFYNLSLSDSTANILKLKLVHDSTNNLTNLDSVNTNQQLCHLRINISSFNITAVSAYWDTLAMAGASLYKSTPNGLQFPYDKILVSGLVGSPQSGNQIDYALESFSVVDTTISFSIKATDYTGDTYAGGSVFVNYNVAAFGNNIASRTSVNAGSLDHINYYITFSDYSLGVLEVDINDTNLVYDDNLPKVVANLSIPFSRPGCVNSADISLNPSLTTGSSSSFYDAGVGSTSSYDTAVVSGSDNDTLCVPLCSGLTIQSIYGPDVNDPLTIIAGSFDTLTITGCGFGATKGQVLFPNANSGGYPSQTGTQLPDILLWTDNMIKCWVPSTLGPLDAKSAGSGKIRVVSSVSGDTSALSGDALNIPYSLLNYRDPSSLIAYRVALQNQNGDGGYTFTPAASITPGQLAAITQAMNDWDCQTGIKFKMGPPTNNPVLANDSINTIVFGTTAGPSILWSTQTYLQTVASSCESGAGAIVQISNIDMVISNAVTWDTIISDTAVVPAGQHSLLGDARHEFGHASGLDHVLNSTLMFWKDPGGGMPPLQIQNADQNGGLFELNNVGPIYLNTGCYAQDSFPPSCPTLAIQNGLSNIDGEGFNLTVFPNPFNETITVRLSMGTTLDVSIKLFDILGQSLGNYEYGKKTGNVEETINVAALSAGVYIIDIKVGENNIAQKLIKN